MVRRRVLNPGEGVQSQWGYGPKLSKRGIDRLYSQGSEGIGHMSLQGGGCMGPYGTPMQAGGFNFKDVVNGVKKGWNWAKNNKPLEKLNKFLDDVVPAQIKGNPIYGNIRNFTGQASKQLGIGQTGTLLGPMTYQRGMIQPITARRGAGMHKRKRVQRGGSKTAKRSTGSKKTQAGGRKRRSRK